MSECSLNFLPLTETWIFSEDTVSCNSTISYLIPRNVPSRSLLTFAYHCYSLLPVIFLWSSLHQITSPVAHLVPRHLWHSPSFPNSSISLSLSSSLTSYIFRLPIFCDSQSLLPTLSWPYLFLSSSFTPSKALKDLTFQGLPIIFPLYLF